MVFFVSCFCPFGSLDIRFVCCLKTWSKKGDTFCFDAPSSGFSVVVVFEIGGIGVRKFLWLIVLGRVCKLPIVLKYPPPGPSNA